MKRVLNNTWDKIVDWFLRRKNLNHILYVLSAFLIKELAAISAGSDIKNFAENFKGNYPDSALIEVFADLVIVFFSSGSQPVLIITLATIILILYVRFFDDSNLSPVLKALGFLGLSAVVLLTIINLDFNSVKVDIIKYQRVLKEVQRNIANETPTVIKTNSYLDHIKKSNSDFTSFLKEFNDSLTKNPNYTGVAYVTAPAGFGKSYFTKKWIEQELKDKKVGKIKVREDFVCGEQESRCFADSLGYIVTKQPDLISESKNGESKSLGHLYKYTFSLDSILHQYKFENNTDVIMVDDLDEVSDSTMNKYLKDFENIIEKGTYPDLNLIVFLSRPEALVNYLSNTYRKNPKVDKIYGLEQKTLQKPIFSTREQILDRINDWANWYQKEKLGRLIDDTERNHILTQVFNLYNKYDFIKLQLQIQSNSDFLFRGTIKNRINQNTEENEIKTILFNTMVGRNSDTHLRPMLDSNEGVIYMEFLKEVVLNEINIKEISENEGWFIVNNNEKVSIDLDGATYTTTVKSLLNRSGLITIDPIDSKLSKYRFEPFWIHEYLLNKTKKDSP
ncbi:hypothetical protein [Poritiphilus flavus]|uniref:Uncharacterized protein n=1 Tax=Poritiphilus flavus TaxID=2697053 RepID=A0A6L9ECB6_9FLAO|nr:hypothetical protein [Poritiphilus flavus]NAS12283.1 hypothetical protein [Poritiphilus flavus]